MPLHLILGGRCMGKRAYAESLYGEPVRENFFDLADCDALAKFKDLSESNILSGKIWLVNLQDGVRFLMQRERDIQKFFTGLVRRTLQECMGRVIIIAIGTEVGGGVVPMDLFERRWRDETGKLYQALAAEADRVDRVWAGLSASLKA